MLTFRLPYAARSMRPGGNWKTIRGKCNARQKPMNQSLSHAWRGYFRKTATASLQHQKDGNYTFIVTAWWRPDLTNSKLALRFGSMRRWESRAYRQPQSKRSIATLSHCESYELSQNVGRYE